MTEHKIMGLEGLAALRERWRGLGERVVFANGCFDLLHAGHVRYLQAARAEGDRLVVGINSDASTQELKGAGRPILNQEARARLVAGLGVVDAVTVFEELTVEPLLRGLRPEVHAKGTDYTAESVPEAAIAAELGIAIRIVGDEKRHSTEALLKQAAWHTE